MSGYTVDMFCRDHDEMVPILRALKHVELTKDEWPRINFEGTVYAINPNTSEADTIGFFQSKYGKDQAADYSTRYLSVIWFINDNRDALMAKQLIRDCGPSQTEIREELLEVLLNSFSPPQPPCIVPTSTLQKEHHTFDLERVIKAAESLIED